MERASAMKNHHLIIFADILQTNDRIGCGPSPIDPPLNSASEEYPLTRINVNTSHQTADKPHQSAITTVPISRRGTKPAMNPLRIRARMLPDFWKILPIRTPIKDWYSWNPPRSSAILVLLHSSFLPPPPLLTTTLLVRNAECVDVFLRHLSSSPTPLSIYKPPPPPSPPPPPPPPPEERESSISATLTQLIELTPSSREETNGGGLTDGSIQLSNWIAITRYFYDL